MADRRLPGNITITTLHIQATQSTSLPRLQQVGWKTRKKYQTLRQARLQLQPLQAELPGLPDPGTMGDQQLYIVETAKRSVIVIV